jgi:hypothetical protein
MPSTRTTQLSQNSVLNQAEDGVIILLEESVGIDNLKDEVIRGLLPIGSVIALMPHMAGSFQPGASGAINDGLMLCDGAAIPAGNYLQGNTPNINNSVYLKGSSGSSSTIFSSNDRTINTPELASHSHPITIAVGNAPHTHPNAINVTNVPHSHPITITSKVTSHRHIGSIAGANMPHTHPQTFTSNAGMIHTHPIAITTADAPHTHPDVVNNTFFGPFHSHLQSFVIEDPAQTAGPARQDFNLATTRRQTYNGGPPTYLVAHNHTHPGGGTNNNNTGTHSHTTTTGTANVPHTHPITMDAANIPHSHTINTGTHNMPHTHPSSVASNNISHTHPYSVNAANMPHDHPGTISGNTGSGNTVNFEPKYINTVYVIRVI